MDSLQAKLQKRFCGGESGSADSGFALSSALGEVCLQIPAASLSATMQALRDENEFAFAQLTDIAGVDYADYAAADKPSRRFAVVYHLLSLQHNCRLRVRAFCEDDDFPRPAVHYRGVAVGGLV